MNKRMRWLTTLALWLLAAVVHAGTVTYVYTDPQGTPLAEANASGTITATYDYTPYGSPVASMGGSPNGPGYTGHVNDPETGLVYMQARFYDPAMGRFLSVDPIGPTPHNIFAFNRYTYGSNNPILNIDPDGRQDVPMVTVSLRDGSTVTVPSAYAQNVIMADATNSTSSDYANPSIDREAAASALDDTSLAAGVTTIAIAPTPAAPAAVVTGLVDEATAILAWAAKPTKERAINVATAQMARAIKIAAKFAKNEKVIETVEAAEKAKTVAEAAKRADEEQQKRREEQEQRRREQQQAQHGESN